jgi:hypothetical protein
LQELVKAEESIEESGMIDLNPQGDLNRALARESVQFLQYLKDEFIEAANTFNQIKKSPLGRIKIYSIAKTEADFMLFRNGYKMIFSLKSPGQVSIRFNFIGPNFMEAQMPTVTAASAISYLEEHVIEAKCGPFNELLWTYQGQSIKVNNLIRHHLSMFVRESAK